MCSIKYFPFNIEHCIEWGRSIFEKEFTNTPNELKLFIENKESYMRDLENELG